MEQPVVIRFRWTADELLRAYRYHFRHLYPRALRFAANFIFALNIWIGYCLARERASVAYVALGIALMALGVYFFVLRRAERRWMIRRQFSKRPDKDVELEWQITSEQIQSQSVLGHSQFSWQALSKVVRTPEGVLVYPHGQMFHWLPRHGFASDADFERFIELAKQKIQRYDEVA
jgi:hypothetical protein